MHSEQKIHLTSKGNFTDITQVSLVNHSNISQNRQDIYINLGTDNHDILWYSTSIRNLFKFVRLYYLNLDLRLKLQSTNLKSSAKKLLKGAARANKLRYSGFASCTW